MMKTRKAQISMAFLPYFPLLYPPFPELKPPFPGLKPPFPWLEPPFPGLKPPFPELEPPLPGLNPPFPELEPLLPGLKPPPPTPYCQVTLFSVAPYRLRPSLRGREQATTSREAKRQARRQTIVEAYEG